MLIKTPPSEKRLEAVEIAKTGGVAAGRTVPFRLPDESIIVALTPAQARSARNGLIEAMSVFGDSLIDAGIADGDDVVVEHISHKRQITANTICVIRLPNGETVAKLVVIRKDMITLRSCNENIPDKHFAPDDIEIVGRIIAVSRTPNKKGSFAR